MGLYWFGGKKVFFEETVGKINENQRAQQAHQEYRHAFTGKELIHQKIFRYNEQRKEDQKD